MKNKKLVSSLAIFIIVFSFILISITSCAKKQEPEVIKIGAILPLTGNLAVIGEPEKSAILIAQDAGIKTTKLKIFLEDNKGDPKESINIVNRLYSLEGVKIYLVSPSPAILSVIPIIKKFDGILFAITSMPNIGDGQSVFNICPNSKQEMIQLSKWLNKEGVSQIVFIYPNNDLGQIIYKTFSAEFKGKIIFAEAYQLGTRDYRSLITKIKNQANNIRWISFQGYPGDIPIFIKQARELGIKAKVITSMATTWPETIKDLSSMNETPIFMVPSVMIEEFQSPEARNFVCQFFNKTKKYPNWDAYYSFEIIMMIKKFSESTNYFTMKELKSYLQNETYKGITGEIRLNSSGEINVPFIPATIIKGRIVRLE